jgi:hypothetical protein
VITSQLLTAYRLDILQRRAGREFGEEHYDATASDGTPFQGNPMIATLRDSPPSIHNTGTNTDGSSSFYGFSESCTDDTHLP